MPNQSKQLLRLSTAEDIVSAIPYLLGFPPECSLVVIGLRPRGSKFRVAVTMRVDLPAQDDIRDCVDRTLGRLSYHHIPHAVLAIYAEPDDLPYDPGELMAVLERQAGIQSIDVIDALLVGEGRWHSYTCRNPQCCPPEGTPISDTPSLAVLSAVAAGLAPAPSREALYERIRPASEIARVAVEQAVERATEAAARTLRSRNGRRRFRDEALAGIATLIERHTPEAPVRPTHVEAARALVGLADVVVRDVCMGWVKRRRGLAAAALWTELVRLSTPPLGAAPAALLAYVSWQHGEGAMANIALERALFHDPAYSLARLLDEAIQRGVHPTAMGPRRVHATVGRPPAPTAPRRA